MKPNKLSGAGLALILVLLTGSLQPHAASQESNSSSCLLITGSIPIPGQYVAGSAQGSTYVMTDRILIDAVSGQYTHVYIPPAVPDFRSSVEFSPDGKYKAQRLSVDTLIIETVNTGKVITISHANLLTDLPQWSPDGNYLYYLATDQNQRTKHTFLGLALADGTHASRLIPASTEFGLDSRNFDPFRNDSLWSPDGQYFKLIIDRSILLVVQTNTWQTQLVAIPDVISQGSVWSPRGHYLTSLWTNDAGNFAAYKLTIFDPATQHEAAIFSPTGFSILYFEWSPNGKYLLTRMNSSLTDFTLKIPNRIAVYDPNGVLIADVGEIQLDSYGAFWLPNSEALIVMRSEASYLSLYSLSEKQAHVILSDLLNSYPSYSRSEQALIVKQRQGTQTSLVKFDLITLHATTLAVSNDDLQIDTRLPTLHSLYYFHVRGVDAAINMDVTNIDLYVADLKTGESRKLLSSVAELVSDFYGQKDIAPIGYWWRTNNGEIGLNGYTLSGQLVYQLKPYLLSEPKHDLNPAIGDVDWSPDRQRAVFQSAQGSLRVIFRNLNEPIILAHQPQTQSLALVWSPDSRMFALVKNLQTDQSREQMVQIYSESGKLLREYQGMLDYGELKWTDCAFSKETF